MRERHSVNEGFGKELETAILDRILDHDWTLNRH